jgi:branched-chain amino acid transport system ATP-binding protein
VTTAGAGAGAEEAEAGREAGSGFGFGADSGSGSDSGSESSSDSGSGSGSGSGSDSGELLVLDGVAKAFGGVRAVDGVSLTVRRHELRGLIGPNGAGKSTLFSLITGRLTPDQGTAVFDGRQLFGLPAERRARAGVGVVFQSAPVFERMTVLENAMVGAHARTRAGFLDALVRTPRHRREERLIRDRAHTALTRVGLADRADVLAGALPLGDRRGVALARALCGEPRLLLLDEPASGLRAGEREELAELLGRLREDGLTMMLVEHDVAFVARLADRITVLASGAVIAEGTPDRVLADPAVADAYLGTSTETEAARC